MRKALAAVAAVAAVAGLAGWVLAADEKAARPAAKDRHAPGPGDVQVEFESFALTEAPVVEADNASGGKAVEFPQMTARAETTVTLPMGEYAVEVFLKGRSLNNDTVWVKVGDAEPAKAFPSHPRLPMVDFQPSLVGGKQAPVTVTVAEERKTLAVVVTPKETEMTLDRMIFRLKPKAK